MENPINAQRSDKKTVIDILSQSFVNDPQVNWIVGEGKSKEKRIKRLMAYAFEQGILNGRIQLSSDRKAVSIWRNHYSKKMDWYLLAESIKFLISFGFGRLGKITKMEKQIASNYPKNELFEYLWFIGTLPNEQGKGYGSALLNDVFTKSKQDRINIYLETTTDSNVKYYSKKGLKLYDTLLIEAEKQLRVYLLKTNY